MLLSTLCSLLMQSRKGSLGKEPKRLLLRFVFPLMQLYSGIFKYTFGCHSKVISDHPYKFDLNLKLFILILLFLH